MFQCSGNVSTHDNSLIGNLRDRRTTTSRNYNVFSGDVSIDLLSFNVDSVVIDKTALSIKVSRNQIALALKYSISSSIKEVRYLKLRERIYPVMLETRVPQSGLRFKRSYSFIHLFILKRKKTLTPKPICSASCSLSV